MPTIYLKETQGSYETGSGTVNVSAEEPYKPSNLFTRYKHTLKSPKEGQIFICNGKYNAWTSSVTCFTITTDGTHQSAKLKEAHVYFNKYDTAKTPLIFVLLFENGVPTAGNKYHKLFRIQRELGKTKNISKLDKYEEKNFLQTLLRYNDVILKSITYQIDQQTIYNSSRINISMNNKLENGQPNGFYKYTHKPIVEGRKSYILYNKDVLVKKGKEPIEEIQGKEVNSKYEYSLWKRYKKELGRATCNLIRG